MRLRSRRLFLTLVALVAGGVNCAREATSPLGESSNTTVSRGIAFRAVFPGAAGAGSLADVVPFTTVRVTLRHPDRTIALDTLVTFPPSADQVQLGLSVHLLPGTTASGEVMSLVLNYLNAAGDVVFSGGPVTVVATPSSLGVGTAPPVSVPVVYTGVGANATKVVITPKTLTASAGGTFTITAQAFDASNNVIPNTPIVFTSSNASLATFPNAGSGAGQAGTARGIAQITASLLTGNVTDVATLTVQPQASSLAVVSGSGQSGTLGATLPQPVVFRVTATDNGGVSGVPVTFSPSNGGSASPAAATSDANGNVQTSWTLGSATGAQTLTASATGFTFSTQATATATPLPATRLVITQQPSSVGVNAPFSITVVAQNAVGGTVTSFTGPVTLSLSANSGSATLTGTQTVTAAGGIATFTGLTLNRAGSAYTILAATSGLTSATSTPFDVVTASPAAIILVSGGNQTATQGTVLPQPIVVQVNDAASAPVANTTVQFLATSGNGTVSPVSVQTGATGQASTTWTLGTTTGTQVISASAGSLAPLQIQATATAPVSSVSQLVFTQSPASAVAGASFSYVVEARSATNAVVTSFNGAVTLSLATNPGNATLAGTTTVNAVNGVATFSNSITRAANGYGIAATTGTVTGAAPPLSIAPAAASALTLVSGGAQTATVSTALPQAVVVALADQFGNAIQGAAIAFTVTSGGGSVNPPNGTTNASGQLSTTWTLGATVGAQSITASASGVSPLTVSATGTTAPAGPAASLIITSSPASGTAGTALANVTVQARDAQNQLATSFNGSVTLGFGANPANGTLAGTTTVTATNGVATFSGLSINRASASYTLVASASGLTSSPAAPLSIQAAAASSLAFTTQPTSTSAGTVISPALVVSAQDAFGNVATSFTGNVTIAIGTNPGSATLSGTTSVAAVNGVATFSTLSVGSAGNGYTLVAAASGLTGATSSAFNITTAVLNWTNPSGGNWSVATNWSLGRAPVAGDSVVIDLSGTYTVTLDVNYAGRALTLGGSSGVQTFAMSGKAFGVSGAMTINPTGALSVSTSTLAGTGTVTNGGAITLLGSTNGMTVANNGTLTIIGSTSQSGALSNSASGVLRLQGSNQGGDANLTVSTGFMNAGLIELTSINQAFSEALTITSGTLTNASGGTIQTTAGSGGNRVITVSQLSNQGALTINQPLTLGYTGAWTNTGTIAAAAPLTLAPSGGGASFSNAGAITVASLQSLNVTGIFTNQAAGTISGAGTAVLTNATVTLNAPISLPVTSAISTTVGGSSVTNSGSQTLTLQNSTLAAPLTNAGTLTILGTSNTISGAFSNSASGVLRLQGSNQGGGANLAVSTGFTNAGLIELTSSNQGFSEVLTITSGTLTNASGGTIQTSAGSGGNRTIALPQLSNQGTLTINQPLTLNYTGASTNSGTITATTGLTLAASGGGASFSNAGTITLPSGQTLSANGAFTNQSSAAISGAGSAVFTSAAVTLDAPISLPVTSLISTTLGGSAVTNTSAQTLTLQNSTLAAPLTNAGTLTIVGTSNTISGAFSNAASGVLRLQGSNQGGDGNVTVSTGFTNAGLIELTSSNQGFSEVLTITSGTLTNAPGGTIQTTAGSGGNRTITLPQFSNQSTVTINQPLTLGYTGASTNSGTITATAGLVLAASGGGASFSNAGVITVPSGQALSVTGTFANQPAGTISGAGSAVLTNATVTLNAPISLPVTSATNTTLGGSSVTNTGSQTLTLQNSTLAGPLTNAGTLTIMGTSNTISGAFSNAASGVLRLQGSNQAGDGNVTVSTGFTNAGLIELTSSNQGFNEALTITSGTLTNASGASILISAGSGGNRTISVPQLSNPGTLTINQPLTLAYTGASTNTGTITATAGLTLAPSGGGSFSNASIITVPVNQTLSVSGTFTNQGSGSISGAGRALFTNATATFNAALSIAITTAVNSTLGGPTFSNTLSQTLTLENSTLSAPLTNAGTVSVTGSSTISGAFSNSSTGSVLLLGTNGSGNASLTVSSGFTNSGLITLTSSIQAFSEALTITSGILTNAAGGSITAIAGSGGNRTVNVQRLVNQGTIQANQPLAFVLSDTSASNSGTINAVMDVTFTLASSQVFTNTGTIAISSGRTLTVNSGQVNNTGGTVSGSGTLALSSSSLSSNVSLSVSQVDISQSQVFSTTTIPAGQTWTILNASFTGAVTNSGSMIFRGTSNSIISTLSQTVTGTVVIRGESAIGDAKLTISSGVTNAGLIDLTSLANFNSNLTLSAGTLTNQSNGILQSSVGGGGTRTITAPQVSNQGTINVAVGGTGTLNISGSLTSSGIINIKLASASAFDRIVTSSTDTLGGTLNVTSSFAPSSGTAFQILAAGGMNGSFSTVNLPSGFVTPPTYSGTSVTVTKQ